MVDTQKERNKQEKSKTSQSTKASVVESNINSQKILNKDFETIKKENITLEREAYDLKKIIADRDKVVKNKESVIDGIKEELNDIKTRLAEINIFMETAQKDKLITIAKFILKLLGNESDLDDVVVVANDNDNLIKQISSKYPTVKITVSNYENLVSILRNTVEFK